MAIKQRFGIFVMLIIGLALLAGCSRPVPANEGEKHPPVSDAQYLKEMEESKKNMRSEIRVKLKKDGKGTYSWEISGKDLNEIIKANSILSKKINND